MAFEFIGRQFLKSLFLFLRRVDDLLWLEVFDYLKIDLKEVHRQLFGHWITRKVLSQVNESVQYRLLFKFSDQSFGE